VLLGATWARVARGKTSRSNVKRPVRLASCLLMFLQFVLMRALKSLDFGCRRRRTSLQ